MVADGRTSHGCFKSISTTSRNARNCGLSLTKLLLLNQNYLNLKIEKYNYLNRNWWYAGCCLGRARVEDEIIVSTYSCVDYVASLTNNLQFKKKILENHFIRKRMIRTDLKRERSGSENEKCFTRALLLGFRPNLAGCRNYPSTIIRNLKGKRLGWANP